jgi:hypothetical protein
MTWSYPPELAEALLHLGLAPRTNTPPRLVRDALNDLYRYEIRRLRDVFRAGGSASPNYVDRVIGLRKKYWPLSMQVDVWEEICQPQPMH